MTAAPATGRAVDPARTVDPARIVFFGSGSFAVPILDAVAAHPQLRLLAVVTVPDRPAGRSGSLTATPVAERARSLRAVVLQPAKVRTPESVAAIAALEPDLGVLADYGQIIPGALLDVPRLGVLGVHPSLLPEHRGATPIQATIRRGDPVAGVTIYRMDDGIDTGPILASERWSLAGDETAPALEAAAASRGAALLRSTLDRYVKAEIEPSPQPATTSEPTRPLRREDGRLDPAQPAEELERLVRAYAGWPGTFIDTAEGRVIVDAASVAPAEQGDAPGQLVGHDGRAAMVTSEGRLVLEGVQLAGRRAMRGDEFLRGRPGLIGSEVLSVTSGTGQ